jgi:hypothetical protein
MFTHSLRCALKAPSAILSGLALVALLPLLAACAAAPAGPSAPAADPQGAARPVSYRPVLSGYESARPAEPQSWRERNQNVTPQEKKP